MEMLLYSLHQILIDMEKIIVLNVSTELITLTFSGQSNSILLQVGTYVYVIVSSFSFYIFLQLRKEERGRCKEWALVGKLF